MMPLLCVLATVVLTVPPPAAAAPAKTGTAGMDTTKWREDLAVFREQMPKTHANLFHDVTREQFNAAVDALEEKLPKLTSNQVKTEIFRLLAMVKDGHTRPRQETFGNHMLPVRLHFFADGLFVEAADSRYAALVGGKVTAIGAFSAERAYDAVRPLLPVDRDNELRRRLLAPDLLVTPEVLQAIGATPSDQSVELTVEKDGRKRTATLPAGPFRPESKHGWEATPKGWITAHDAAKRPLPLWLQHTDLNYWHTFLPDGHTLYVQFNNVQDQPGGEPISQYFPRLFAEAERRNIDRVILDLRLNGGGNNTLLRPLWHALLKSDRLNQKGRLWVLIGPKTFSAAMNCVDELESNTNALFAGEPTGETPNMWGDPADITLPNSGFVVQASTLWWQMVPPWDHRVYRAPDLPVNLTFADFARNIDPVMKAIEAAPHR